jgi:hypothetical protein
MGTGVDGDLKKKDRRRKMVGAEETMDQAAGKGTGRASLNNEPRGTEMDEGMSPNLQAHIGHHVRVLFDEVAREPIPEHLLRLLKDLDRSGDE